MIVEKHTSGRSTRCRTFVYLLPCVVFALALHLLIPSEFRNPEHDVASSWHSGPNGDVDIVIPWVNGSDLSWYRRFLRDSTDDNVMIDKDTYIQRYISGSELRVCIRSIFHNAPWVHRVYLVTDAQWPYWLNASHPRIARVDHRDILPQSVYDSQTVQLALDRIPGLSEHFVLMDDDMLIYRPIEPWYFFDQGRSQVAGVPFVGEPGLGQYSPNSSGGLFLQARKHSYQAVMRRFPKYHGRICHFGHVSIPVRRSALAAFERFYDLGRHRRFREVSGGFQPQDLITMDGMANNQTDCWTGGRTTVEVCPDERTDDSSWQPLVCINHCPESSWLTLLDRFPRSCVENN